MIVAIRSDTYESFRKEKQASVFHYCCSKYLDGQFERKTIKSTDKKDLQHCRLIFPVFLYATHFMLVFNNIMQRSHFSPVLTGTYSIHDHLLSAIASGLSTRYMCLLFGLITVPFCCPQSGNNGSNVSDAKSGIKVQFHFTVR